MISNNQPSTVIGSGERSLKWLRRVIVLALLAPALFFLLVAAHTYREEFAAARATLDGATRVAQEHALKLFDTNEMLLQRMLDMLGDTSDEQLLARGEELHKSLRRMTASLPQVQGVYVTGADGRMVASDRVYPPPRHIDYSDREYFIAHRAGGQGAFVSAQLVSRSTGEAFFDISRRRSRVDGSFAGMVNVSLRPQYLTDFYKEIEAREPGLRFAVLRADGSLVARWPGEMKPGTVIPVDSGLMRSIASGAPQGHADGLSAFDPVERLRSWRRLGTYPLYVVVGIGEADVLAAWWKRTVLLALFSFPLALGLAWMAWFALRRTQDELQGMRRLEEETAHRQRIELALVQSQKLEAMGRLAGGIAHDFNNLMMIVSNNLYLLRHLYPNLVESQQLEAIERAIGSGTKLTRQILAFSRQQPLKPERILMQERIPGLLDLLQPVLGRSIEVTGHAAEDTAAINIDPAELELALINLAVNAKDAMPDGGKLGIVARNASPDDTHGLKGSFVVLEVSDTGTGIDPGVIDRVFEPFFTTKPVGYGTGLGLSQVHALCKRAGGTARITSDASGTVVSLLLPQQDDPLESASKTHVLPTRQLSCRLLLVEDNEALAEGTAELLQAMGCRVRRARDGKSALSSVEGEPFDVVLSDIEMPGGLDGIALATAFGERYPALPILLMSGYASRLDEAIRRGFTVLPKPCTPQVLAEALHNALAGTRNQVA